LVWSETEVGQNRIAGQCCNKVTNENMFRPPFGGFDYAWSEMALEFELYSPRSRQSGMDRRGPGRTYHGIDRLQRRRVDVRVERRAAILREIEKRCSDPGLSAISVAKLLGITPRYVHLLLKETGTSFSHHVLDRRLEKAAALLRDSQWRHRLIIEIAAEAGFTDISHFNRAFRRKFRATPSVIREASGRDEKTLSVDAGKPCGQLPKT